MNAKWIVATAVLCIGVVFAGGVSANPYEDFREKTYEVQLEYLKSVSAHQVAVMEDLEYKLAQQRWQTNAIAAIVFVMVGLGLTLSYLQFRLDSLEGSKSSFTLSVGQSSLQLSSSVIGLVILVLSFWFFQAYVDRVYSVEVFDLPPVDMTTFGVNR